MENKNYKTSPFVKWIGGKNQLLSELMKYIPDNYNDYFEPFVGGGALFFNLQPKHKVYINDRNSALIGLYNQFKDDSNYNQLIELLNLWEEFYNKELSTADEKSMMYYEFRKEFNETKDPKLLLFLNKVCFNGLYRENRKGQFNAAWGKKDKISLYDLDNFKNIKSLFDYYGDNLIITNDDFEKILSFCKSGDLIYFDPPYDYANDGFTNYNSDNFYKEDQIRLFNAFDYLSKKGCYCILSNNNTEFIRNLYKDYNLNIVKAKRKVNVDSTKRGDVEELIITNFKK